MGDGGQICGCGKFGEGFGCSVACDASAGGRPLVEPSSKKKLGTRTVDVEETWDGELPDLDLRKGALGKGEIGRKKEGKSDN